MSQHIQYGDFVNIVEGEFNGEVALVIGVVDDTIGLPALIIELDNGLQTTIAYGQAKLT